MGSKLERQHQYQNWLKRKIKKFEKKGKNVDKLKKELSFCAGDAQRPTYATGRDAGEAKSQEKFSAIKRKKQQLLEQ
jgi:hypothetical protein